MPSFKPNNLEAGSFEVNSDELMPNIYSYPFPEVRELLEETQIDEYLMMNTLTIEEADTILAEAGIEPPLEVPVSKFGTADLDEIHEPVLDRITNVLEGYLHGLSGFEHRYPVHGSSQAIFNILAEWRARGRINTLAVLEGDYEGYKEFARSLCVPLEVHEQLPEYNAKKHDGRVWMLSNPSALDGDWISKERFNNFVEGGHKMILDTAYAGLTESGEVDLSAENILAVVTSPSKMFGVFRHRMTGVTYSRIPITSMYSNKWFKDVPALLETLKLQERYGDRSLAAAYRPIQKEICRQLSEYYEATVEPADVLLLGRVACTEEPVEDLKDFERARNYRFGLTRIFEAHERFLDQLELQSL